MTCRFALVNKAIVQFHFVLSSPSRYCMVLLEEADVGLPSLILILIALSVSPGCQPPHHQLLFH
jgi:hypothetical protein